MKLVANWWTLIKRAWSIRLMLLAGILSGAEIALPLLDGYLPIPRGLFAILSALATGGAFIARLVAQQNIHGEDQ